MKKFNWEINENVINNTFKNKDYIVKELVNATGFKDAKDIIDNIPSYMMFDEEILSNIIRLHAINTYHAKDFARNDFWYNKEVIDQVFKSDSKVLIKYLSGIYEYEIRADRKNRNEHFNNALNTYLAEKENVLSLLSEMFIKEKENYTLFSYVSIAITNSINDINKDLFKDVDIIKLYLKNKVSAYNFLNLKDISVDDCLGMQDYISSMDYHMLNDMLWKDDKNSVESFFKKCDDKNAIIKIFTHLPKELKENKELILLALEKEPEILNLVPKKTLIDVDILNKTMGQPHAVESEKNYTNKFIIENLRAENRESFLIKYPSFCYKVPKEWLTERVFLKIHIYAYDIDINKSFPQEIVDKYNNKDYLNTLVEAYFVLYKNSERILYDNKYRIKLPEHFLQTEDYLLAKIKHDKNACLLDSKHWGNTNFCIKVLDFAMPINVDVFKAIKREVYEDPVFVLYLADLLDQKSINHTKSWNLPSYIKDFFNVYKVRSGEHRQFIEKIMIEEDSPNVNVSRSKSKL